MQKEGRGEICGLAAGIAITGACKGNGSWRQEFERNWLVVQTQWALSAILFIATDRNFAHSKNRIFLQKKKLKYMPDRLPNATPAAAAPGIATSATKPM